MFINIRVFKRVSSPKRLSTLPPLGLGFATLYGYLSTVPQNTEGFSLFGGQDSALLIS